MQYKCIKKEEWDKVLDQFLLSYTIFANIENDFGLDYELIGSEDIERISYNRPKPATSLKSFFLPAAENVTSDIKSEKPRIIIGVPNCDIKGLSILDEIYLDSDFCDTFYRKRRENTILISSDCNSINEHCHCLSYDVKPYSNEHADIAVNLLDDIVALRIITAKGEDLVNRFHYAINQCENNVLAAIEKLQQGTEKLLLGVNKGLPGYKESGRLINESGADIWEKYSLHCVTCGACVTVCPTCSCFILIDKPGLEKVKHMDGCQYPGFERVAGGEDPLHELHNRFRNRYMCKYVWKPAKFHAQACTGCGRCIEACIGKINKNEIFMEMANHFVNAG
jgi:sulfhydrogenase subunit beta (sulfur reductase)